MWSARRGDGLGDHVLAEDVGAVNLSRLQLAIGRAGRFLAFFQHLGPRARLLLAELATLRFFCQPAEDSSPREQKFIKWFLVAVCPDDGPSGRSPLLVDVQGVPTANTKFRQFRAGK